MPWDTVIPFHIKKERKQIKLVQSVKEMENHQPQEEKFVIRPHVRRAEEVGSFLKKVLNDVINNDPFYTPPV